MTIEVSSGRTHTEYEQFDPLKVDLEMFHVECHGGRVTSKLENSTAVRFTCGSCGDTIEGNPVRCRTAMRTVLITAKPTKLPHSSLAFSPRKTGA